MDTDKDGWRKPGRQVDNYEYSANVHDVTNRLMLRTGAQIIYRTQSLKDLWTWFEGIQNHNIAISTTLRQGFNSQKAAFVNIFDTHHDYFKFDF